MRKQKNNKLSPERVFAHYKITTPPQHALHMDWILLSETISALLTGLLERNVEASSEREEYYYWGIHLHKTPLTRDEIEIIFRLSEADELDREQNDYGEYPIIELCQSLCEKLMGKLLLFAPSVTLADDAGVWFISSDSDKGDKQSITKALPNGRTLVAETWDEPDYPGIRISLRIPGAQDELICFAEHSSTKSAGKELCIAVYAQNHDDPVYYESYSDPQAPSPNN